MPARPNVDLGHTLHEVRDRILGYRARRVRLTESDTIRVLILPVLSALGWNMTDVEEVRSEYRHRASDNPVDYALFLQSTPSLFVEAKALEMSLDERKPLVQTLNYANAAGVDWCVLTNGAEYRIYKVHAPVEAEEKLFLTVRLDNPTEGAEAQLDALASRLSLISRDQMRTRAIDVLWTDWRIDRQVEAVLDNLSEDEAFIRMVARRLTGLTAGDVRGSLRRSGLRSFYPRIEELMGSGVSARCNEVATEQPELARSSSEAVPAARKGRTRLMNTREMVAQGLLAPGTVLTIKGRPGSEAHVLDGREVEYRGERMSFNAWGCRATGWSAIQIYKWAVLPDGQILETLRKTRSAGRIDAGPVCD